VAKAQQDSSVGRRATPGQSVAGEVMNFSELAASTLRGGDATPARSRSMPRLKRSTSNVQRSTFNGGSEPAEPPATEAGADPMFSAAAAGPAPPASASFLALPDNAVAFNPDSQGAVGPNHLMVTLGSEVRIQDRAGGVISTVSLDAFWGALGSSNVFDPRVLYDPSHQRWLTVAIANPATNDSSLLLAVSQTSDPTGNWFRHQIRVDLTDGVYAASPNLGWCRDWVVVSAAMNDKTGLYFYSADIFAFNRTNLYAGGPAQFMRKVYAPSAGSLDAENIPVPAVCYDASFATNFLVANWDGSHAGGPGRLRLFTVSGPVLAPVFDEFESLGGLFVSAGAAWGNPSWLSTSPGNTNFAPQAGSPVKIFIGDARIQNVVYRNGLLWCTHHVFLPTNAATRSAVQWWSFSPGGTVLQHGRVDDPTGVRFFAYPSIAVNRYDDVLLGYSRFAANQFVSANYAFHGYEAVPGSLSADTVLKAGEAKFAAMDGEDVLWGDWSGAVVDPANDTDLWTIQEYAALPVGGIDRWGTWWGRVSPPVNLSLRAVGSPASVLAGSNVTYSIQVTNRGTHIATGVRLIDTLPPGAAFVSAVASQGACGHTNGVVTCNFGDVAGDIVTNVVVWATIVARLNQGGTATNNVSVLSFGPDASPADNSTKVLTQVSTASDLAVTVSVPPDVVVLSNNVTFTVTVTNLGPGAAASTWLTNVLPAGLTFVSATPTVGSCSHASGRVSCSLATLGMNAGARVTVVARAIASGFATNRANVVSSAIDPALTNNSASAFVKASARPTIQTLSSPQSIAEDSSLGPLTFSIGDVETPPESLVLGRASSNTNLVPVTNIVFGGAGANRFFTVMPLPNASGSVNITRTVTDADGLSATNTFQLNISPVPDPPTISDITNQTVAEDMVIGPLNFIIGDAESSAATLNLSGASSNQGLIPNANITFGGGVSNRTVTVRPMTNMSGSATITVTVSDGGLTASDSFVVTVNEVNDLPTINDVGNRAILEDSTGTTIGLSLGDVEAPAALILSGTSSNLTLVPNGNITFSQTTNTSRTVTIVPAPNQYGTTLITLTVTDANNASATDTFVLTVNGVNDPPTLAALSPLTINEDSGTTNVALSGISFGPSNEGQTNRVTATSSQPGLIPDPTVVYSSPNATGTLSFAPAANSNGIATITVTVNDGGTSNNAVTRTFNVTVNAVNDAPSISAITNVVVNEDTTTVPIPFIIGDAESAATTLSVAARALDTNLIANVVLSGAGSNRTIAVTPALNRSGQTSITVFVGDGTNTNTMTFLMTVREMNDLPSILMSTNQFTINEDQATNISLTIGDVETVAAALTLSVPVNPSLTPNISFGGSGSNRTVNIVPATNLSGTVTIEVFVSDGAGGSNSTSFILTVVSVNDLPTLDAPGNLSIPEDSPVRTVLLSGISSGAPNEAQPLTVTAVSGNPALLANPAVIYSSANSTGRLELLPLPNASGTAAITVSVSDGVSTNSRVFDLTVTAVNDPPSISSIGNRQMDEDTTASVPLVIGDLETPAGQLSVLASSSNPELLDETGIRITGNGTDRTLFLTPLPDQSDGLTTITVTVTDGSNEVAVASFDLTVRAVNDAPTISGLADLTINQGSGPTNIFFTVSDPESLPSSLVATATSLNQALVPNGNLVVNGNGTSRTLTITPVASQSGTAVIQVILRDGPAQGAAVVTNSFVLTVHNMEVSLRIERFGNVAVVSWPTNSPGWTLQSTANVALPGSWNNVSTSPGVVNDRYAVTNALGSSALFYRLRHP
jgi:uncharacterized repeat protein (TIGR01451 family)